MVARWSVVGVLAAASALGCSAAGDAGGPDGAGNAGSAGVGGDGGSSGAGVGGGAAVSGAAGAGGGGGLSGGGGAAAGGAAGAGASGGVAGVGAAAGSGGATTGGAGGADGGSGAGGVDGGSGAAGAAGAPGALLGSFRLTYYWVAYEADYTGVANTALYDRACNVLATVSSAFAGAISLEGTGRLRDGRLLNVSGSCSCPRSPCFLVADAAHPWGYGVQNRALVPFRSVAVDRNVIAYGTKLYLAELDGVRMPGESPWGDFVHDGCVSADDTGGGIVGQHLDFFAALREHYRTLDRQLSLTRVTVSEGGSRCQ